MSHGRFQVPRLFPYLPENLHEKFILDAGCGLGEVGFYIRAFSGRFNQPIKGQPYIVGVDINRNSIDFVKKYMWGSIYNEVHQLDLINLKEYFMARRFDVAMLNEVVEHIPKDKANLILDQVEAISDWVLVSTPLGDELNECYPNTPEFNHVSIWTREDFEKRGYLVSTHETIEFGASPIARLYKFARDTFGTPIQRKIVAVRRRKP